MIYRHTNAQVEEYKEHIGINQSALKVLLNDGVQQFQELHQQLLRQTDLYYEEKKHFIIGSAVDCHLTLGEEAFDEQYFHSELKKKPSEKAMSITKMVFDNISEEFKDDPDGILEMSTYPKQIWEACNSQEYYMNNYKPQWMEDGRMNRLLKDGTCQLYWEDLIKAGKKQVLSDDEYNTINSLIMSFKTHKHTRKYLQDGPDVDIIFQMPIYWEFENVDCKGLVDEFYIDHIKRAIYPFDFKTLGDYILRFPKAAKQRRYDVQGAFYTYGTKQNLDKISEIIGKDVRLYEVKNFAFAVDSTLRPGTPLVFPLTDDALMVGSVGNGDDLRGYIDAVNMYKHWSSIDYSIEEHYKETNGVIFLNGEFKIN